MTYSDLYNKYAQESYQNSVDHGFWEEGETRSKGKMVMLMISELAEAMEGDRKDHHFNPHKKDTDYTKWCFDEYAKHCDNPNYEFRFARPDPALMSDDALFATWFTVEVKNTVEDEMADVAIRIMDFIYGWRCLFDLKMSLAVDHIPDDFAEAMLTLTGNTLHAFWGADNWACPLEATVMLCRKWDIDLDWHIRMKQRFNRTRPIKHGKKY